MPQQLFTGPFNLQQGRTDRIQVLPAFVGQRKSSPTAPEQLLPQVGFQLFDLMTDRTLAYRQFIGSE